MKTLVIAWTNTQRTLRDRLGLFFIILLPVILIVVLGMTYGGMGAPRVGVADLSRGPMSQALVAGLEHADVRLSVRSYGSLEDLRDAVERGFVELGIGIPADYDATLASGGSTSLDYVSQPTTVASAARTSVESVVADEGAIVRAARFATMTSNVSLDDALAAARQRQGHVPGVGVQLEAAGTQTAYPNGFTLGAQSQVILFMFLTSLTGAVPLIVSRQLGISRRMFSTPTPARVIILGEALGRFAFALFQGFFIVVVSGLLFGVDWSDPLATSVLVVAFALVASGAAMLIGTVASNPHQAGAVGPALGMVLGLLGGTMVPPEIFPAAVRTLSHITPHAWAMDAFRELSLRSGHLFDILPQIGALLGFATVLLGIAVWRFRRVILAGAT